MSKEPIVWLFYSWIIGMVAIGAWAGKLIVWLIMHSPHISITWGS